MASADSRSCSRTEPSSCRSTTPSRPPAYGSVDGGRLDPDDDDSTVQRRIVGGGCVPTRCHPQRSTRAEPVYVASGQTAASVPAARRTTSCSHVGRATDCTGAARSAVPADPVAGTVDHFIPRSRGRRVDVGYPRAPGCDLLLAIQRADCSAASVSASTSASSRRPTRDILELPDTGLNPVSMPLSWLADTSQGRMVGDYISTSFSNGIGDRGLRPRDAAGHDAPRVDVRRGRQRLTEAGRRA